MSSRVDHTPEEPGAVDVEPGVDAFVRAVASNIRYLRAQAGLTLAELAAALKVPFARIVEEDRPSLRVVRASEVQPLLSSETPGWAGRLLSASHGRGTFDLYALDLEAGAVRHAEPHHAGVTEHLLVVTGRLRAGPAGNTVELGAGDLVTFGADVPHVYEALETTHCVLLMAYP